MQNCNIQPSENYFNYFFSPYQISYGSSRSQDSEKMNLDIIAEEVISPSVIYSDVAHLLSLSDHDWDNRNTKILDSLLQIYTRVNTPPGKTAKSKGFFEKHDLKNQHEIHVIGDIHGEFEKLKATMFALQKEGALDKNFKCRPGHVVICLGDYLDRGTGNLPVLTMLATFKLMNPPSVFLIRGNHEDLSTVFGGFEHYTNRDIKYQNYIKEQFKTIQDAEKYTGDFNKHLSLLQIFYESLPVGIFISQQAIKVRDYVLFVHGAPHPLIDTDPLLDNPLPDCHLWIDKPTMNAPKFLNLQKIKEGEAHTPKERDIWFHAYRIVNLVEKMNQGIGFKNLYWADIAKSLDITDHIDEESNRLQISIGTLRTLLWMYSTDNAQLKFIVRGHSKGGLTMHNDSKNDLQAVTLDPSGLPHQIYLNIKTAQKISNWEMTEMSVYLKKTV